MLHMNPSILNLIPIIQIKISKEKWLATPIKYDNNYYVKDILSTLSLDTWNWIISKNDIEINNDYESFHNQFVDSFYKNYVK